MQSCTNCKTEAIDDEFAFEAERGDVFLELCHPGTKSHIEVQQQLEKEQLTECIRNNSKTAREAQVMAMM